MKICKAVARYDSGRIPCPSEYIYSVFLQTKTQPPADHGE